MDKFEANMNSQIKNALTDFIKSNKAAVEQEMENGEEHDLAKSEPTIPDLVNYLACPTPQPIPKDAQPMSLEEKGPIHDPNFNPAQQQHQQSQQHQQKVAQYACPGQQHQVGYPSPSQNQQQLSQPGDGNHFGTSGESSFGVGGSSSRLTGIADPKANAHPQHQHQFLQQHQSHYGQNATFYASQHSNAGNASSSNTINNSANTENIVFPEMPTSETSVYAHSSNTAANAGPSLNNFNGQPTLTDQFQTNVPVQQHNPVVSYQGQAQVNTNSFQSNAVLPSSYTQSSPNTHLQPNTLSFEEMALTNHGTIGRVKATQDQFKSTENMHVDEPVSGYSANPGNHAQNISHYQQQNFQTKQNSMEVSFNSDNFAGTNAGFTIDQFDSSLVDKAPPTAKDYGNNAKAVNSNVVQNTTSFELPNNLFPTQPVASDFKTSQFANQNFTQEAALVHQNQQMGIGEFQPQPNANPNNGGLSLHAAQYVTPKPGQGQAASSESQPGFSNNSETPFHNTGYQETNSPVVNNVSSPINDNFHAHASNIDSPHTPTYNNQSQMQVGNNAVETQQFQPHISHQPSPAEEQQYTASPQSNNSDTTLVLSPDYSAVGFQNNVPSPDNFGGQFLSHQQQHEQQQQQQQQQHQQHHQQQPQQQQSGQLHQQNFLNSSPQQHTTVIRGSDNFMAQTVNDVCPQQPQLAPSSNLQYHSAAVNQVQVIDNGVKPSILDNFAGSNNTQFATTANYTSPGDTFPQLDFESLASEEFSVKSSAASDQISQEAQNFNYQYSNTNSHTAPEGSPANFPFNQSDKSLSADAGSQSLGTTGSRPQEQAPTFQAHPGEINLQTIQNAHQENQEKYPHPMQVQDNVFAKAQDTNGQLAYQAPPSRVGETEMDTSTGMADKSQNITQRMSFEEIHSSIVEAGKEFSRKAVDGGNFSQQEAFASPGVQHEAGINVSQSLNCHDSQTNMFFQTSPQIPKTEAVFISHSQSSSLASSVVSSSLVTQNQLGVNFQQISSTSNFDLQTAFPNALSNIQASSSAAGSQLPNPVSSQVFPQLNANEATPIVTMPNFLENPGVMLSCIRASNPENVSMLSPVNFHKPEQAGLVGTNNGQMVMTMIAASPVNSLPVVAKSGTGHPKMAAISSQQHVTQPPLSLGSVSGINPQLINSLANVAGTLMVTQAQAQQQPVSLGIFSQINNQQSQVQLGQGSGRTGVSGLPASAISGPSGVVFQLMPPQANPKPPALTLGMQSNYSKPVDHNTPQTVSSTLPAGTMAVVGGQQSMSQPHIVITLEDLKKLLTQKSPTLSPTSSESKPLQDQHTTPTALSTTSPAPTISSTPIVVPQHIPPLRLIQPPTQQPPRPFLNNPPRLMHPHEQLQQTREKLQQLMQQAQQSQTFPTGLPPHKNQEHTILFTSEESNNQQKVQTSILAIQQDQQVNNKMQIIQQMQVLEQHKHIQEQQMHIQQQQQQQQQQQPQLLQKHGQDTMQNMLFSNKDKSGNDLKLPPLQLPCSQSGQRLIIQHSQFMQVSDQKAGQQPSQGHRVLNLGQVQQEFQAPKGIITPTTEQDKMIQQPTEKSERSDRLCSDSLKKDYKQLHSLLTMDSSTGNPMNRSPFSKVGQLGQVSDGSLNSHNPMAISNSQSKSLPPVVSSSSTASSSFTFMPLSTAPPLSLSSSCSTFLPAAKEGFSFKATAGSFPPPTSGLALTSHANSAPLTTLAFTNALFTSAFSKVSEMKETKDEANGSPSALPSSTPPSHLDSKDSEMAVDINAEPTQRQGSILAQILTENKRSHTPLSVDLSSPANSNSEAPSPLSSPNPYEDSNTQLTLVERSAGLHIKSDTMHGIDDEDGDDTFSDTMYKRPSTEEPNSSGENDPNVPMKIAKASSSMDARSSIPTPTSPEPAFDIGSVVSSTSNFSFAFGNKEETGSEVFTFGSSSTSCSTSESSLVRRSPKPSVSKPVPTQSVRPTTRKQKEYGLKAYYPSRCEEMELKILEQPEAQHRARYQTEGSRGAIKDVSQQGFPVIKLNGYNKKTKLQIYIGDESTRVKPHGFYQACRVFGKNSTPCTEQEIEGTAIIEIDLTPENDMIAKLDCIGILKLRNADVERRIGPKRARDKKKNNTRARLVMRCLVERQNNHGEVMLQTASNAIVCTQPVGQPEICRMSLTESSVEGGESLFIIGKNFKNKGTTVSFQLLDPNDEAVVKWQAGAEIEQEFFQPTHLICKIPQFMDTSIQNPQHVQIVVSCAGKKSDPHKFTYKPEIKQEVPMETDNVSSSRSLSFVSPEALQLNHMVHQSHALSSDSNTIFQLPPGAVPTVETQTSNVLSVKPSFTQAASGLIKPARLVVSNSVSDTSSASPWSPSALTLASATINSSLSPQVSSSPFKLYGDVSTPTSQVTAKLPTFLLDEKPDGLVCEDVTKSSSTSNNQDSSFNCIVHSTSRTQPIPSPSHTVSSGHDGTTLTSSAHVSPTDMSVSAASPEAQKTVASSPIVVLLDTAALQNTENNEQIQQLLQQFINSQNR